LPTELLRRRWENASENVRVLELRDSFFRLALERPISEAQFELLKKELANAKGIDWKNSDRSGFALEATGGARFGEIRAAYQKAGVTLSAPLLSLSGAPPVLSKPTERFA
jgi:hypothetical protein